MSPCSQTLAVVNGRLLYYFPPPTVVVLFCNLCPLFRATFICTVLNLFALSRSANYRFESILLLSCSLFASTIFWCNYYFAATIWCCCRYVSIYLFALRSSSFTTTDLSFFISIIVAIIFYSLSLRFYKTSPTVFENFSKSLLLLSLRIFKTFTFEFEDLP